MNSINSGERQLRLWRTKDGYWILLSTYGQRLPINNAKMVGHKKEWWQFWKK